MPSRGCLPHCPRRVGLWSSSGRKRSEGCSGRRILSPSHQHRQGVPPHRSEVRSWKRPPSSRCGIGPVHPSDGQHGNPWDRVHNPRESSWRTLPYGGFRLWQPVADRPPALLTLLWRLLLLALRLDYLHGHRLRQYLRHGGLLRVLLRFPGFSATAVSSTHDFTSHSSDSSSLAKAVEAGNRSFRC
jgi:hypothetical protein